MSLLELVRRYTEAPAGGVPFRTPVPGLILLRSDEERMPSHMVFKPSLCVTVQGSKWTTFGDRRYDYPAGQALVVSIEMPAHSRIEGASPQEPFLGVVVELDLAVMHEVLEAFDARGAGTPVGNPPVDGEAPERDLPGHGVFVTNFAGPLADCVLRMVRLLDAPDAIPVLAPLIMKEICYWLLTGPQGGDVARLALANAHARRVINAIHVLRDQYMQALSIDDLAAVAQMSTSAFHRQFKALTSMTPLQYQKQLRLMEARNRMLAGTANAETAAYQVGYESPSQFSREYARMFGAPPRRDIEALKAKPQA
jgi:AraC-like DNA-binding protein